MENNGLNGLYDFLLDKRQLTLYTANMIENFKDRRLKRLYERGERSKIQTDLVDKVERVLARLDQALVIEDMDLPGYRLHPLKGDLKGFWSVSISGNWRVIFRFENGKARDVEMIDYH